MLFEDIIYYKKIHLKLLKRADRRLKVSYFILLAVYILSTMAISSYILKSNDPRSTRLVFFGLSCITAFFLILNQLSDEQAYGLRIKLEKIKPFPISLNRHHLIASADHLAGRYSMISLLSVIFVGVAASNGNPIATITTTVLFTSFLLMIIQFSLLIYYLLYKYISQIAPFIFPTFAIAFSASGIIQDRIKNTIDPAYPIVGWVGNGAAQINEGEFIHFAIYLFIFLLLSLIIWKINIAVLKRMEPQN